MWGLHWLRANGTEIRTDLLRAKMQDHRIPASRLEDAAGRAGDFVRSPAFSAELRRFVRRDAARKSLDSSRYLEYLAQEPNVCCERPCAAWGGNPDPGRA